MEIIVLIIIISILAVILFFALRKLITSITEDSKEYYFKKVNEYDKLILEKEEKLKELDSNKDDKDIENNEGVIISKEVDKKLLKLMNDADYENGNALQIANRVDEIFQIDEREILTNFVKDLDLNDDYKIYQKIQDRFSPNLIYKLKMIDKKSQIKYIGDMLTDKEYAVFKSYIDTHNFKLNKFLLDLGLLIERSIPNIEVIVGNRKKNFNDISPYIKTVYSKDVYKGMIIKYQDKIYDYSINERDV